jgi:orotidine-5'-phosphate decarboxylase
VARTATFLEHLHAAAEANRSWLCVGLDPEPTRVPAALRTDDPLEWVPRFLAGIVEATRDLVCCYKPNVGFFEALGAPGWEALRRTLQMIPSGVPTLADAKRGDTPHTMQAYARGLFEQMGFGAITANPYLGGDALAPLFAYPDRGVFVLCKTSNPGSGELQDLTVRASDGREEPVYLHVARQALSWDVHGTLGLVVGATYPAEIAAVRAIAPRLPFLIPGVGAQAGDLEAAVQAGMDAKGRGAIVNASRSVLYASSDANLWQDAARQEAQRLRSAIAGATRARTETSDVRTQKSDAIRARPV